MKLLDGLKLKGRPVIIPGNLKDELPQFFVEMGYKVGTEIGVHKGAFTEKFCQAGLKMYAIDPWMPYTGAGKLNHSQRRQDFLYDHAQRALAPFKDCKIIRKTSMEAVKDFEDESLDFVYIDGDHRFPFVAEDIYEWYGKVRSGGIISGHDYFCTDPSASYDSICHASVIVDAFVSALRIENFYVFGLLNPSDFEAKREFPSWMFFKPYQMNKIVETPLCKLALKYKADKCRRRGKHTYTEYYYKLLKSRRKTIKKVLEIGIGKRASLFMWQDFFPNARIYGADYRQDLLIKRGRIESFLCDQRRKEHLIDLTTNTGPDIDLVVDDASHRPRDQVFTCLTLMPLLKRDVVYIIEDVADLSIVERLTQYDVEVPELDQSVKRYDNRLVVVRHKSIPTGIVS